MDKLEGKKCICGEEKPMDFANGGDEQYWTEKHSPTPSPDVVGLNLPGDNSDKEEWGGWKIVSDMLDHPCADGIYPTSECFQKLYEFVVAQKAKAREEARRECEARFGSGNTKPAP